MASIQSKTGVEKAKGGVSTRSIRDEAVTAQKISPKVLGGSHLFYNGKGQPLLLLSDMSAVASGAQDADHVAVLPGSGHHIFYNPIVGAISTAPYGPQAHASGLDLAPDLTNDEDISYIFGGALATGVPLANPWAVTVERTAGQPVPDAVFMRLKFVIEDVSGSDNLQFGFRKAEDIATAPASYADVAAFKVVSGDIKTSTILAGGAESLVDTTQDWADGEKHELMVVCYGNGKVKFLLDGKEPTVTQAFQFDDAEVVVPFAYIIQAAHLTHVHVDELEIGFLKQIRNLKED